jgi:RNA 2',3'-cyclic 3'-phosphodiesterase
VSAEPHKRRLFIAIELPEDLRRHFHQIQSNWPAHPSYPSYPRMAEMKWVRPSALHITLQFLGQTPGERVAELETALLHAVRGKATFNVSLAPVAIVPTPARPRVLWVPIIHSPALHALQAAVIMETAQLGFPPENRAFSPHITLARFKRIARGAAWTDESRSSAGEPTARGPKPESGSGFVAETGPKFAEPLDGYQLPVAQVTLFESRLLSRGAEYVPLARALLEAPALPPGSEG